MTDRSAVVYWAVLGFGWIGIFIIDVLLPLGYSIATLYIGLVFLAVLSERRRLIIGIALLGALGTWLGHFVKAAGAAESTAPLTFGRFAASILILGAAAGGLLLARRGVQLSQALADLRRRTEESNARARLIEVASTVGRIGGWSASVGAGSDLSRAIVTSWSADVADILGFPHDSRPTLAEVLGRLESGGGDRLRGSLAECIDLGIDVDVEARVLRPLGDGVWVRCAARAVRDDGGEIVSIEGALQDVSQWKRAEDRVVAQRSRFDNLASSVPITIWTAGPDGSIDYFNQALIDYTGATADQLLAHGLRSFVHPEDLAASMPVAERSRATGEPYEMEVRVRRADGAYRWNLAHAVPERNGDGILVRWWGNMLDVHDLREIRDLARREAAERERILQSIGEAVVTLDRQLRFTYVNPAAVAFSGKSKEALLGTPIDVAFPEIIVAEVGAVLHRTLEEGIPGRITHHSLSLERWFDVASYPSEDGVTLFVRDVTEVRQLSAQLEQAQRLESVGQLTGGIAHDFNNLLTVILGGVETALEDDSLSPRATTMLERIGLAAGRGAELTHRLVAFARRQPLEPRPLDVSRHLAEALPLLTHTLGGQVEFVTELADGLPLALVDEAQLEAAIVNLVINAHDAMPDGGTITIETRLAELDGAYAARHADLAPGPYVMTSISDTGGGIPQDDLARVFDPFFTTKPIGRGTGLGLAMVWGFVRQSGGHIAVYSEVGEGTTFRLYLPLAATGATEHEDGETLEQPAVRGSGHVLVVEDDDLVQQFAAERLRERGYTVTTASSGPDALRALDNIDTLDLLFTDVMMAGGLNGPQLAEQVRVRRPGTPVLFTSGYTEATMIHEGRIADDTEMLPKPYTEVQLTRKVASLLRPDREAAS